MSSARQGRSTLRLLEQLAICPRVPTSTVQQLLGLRHVSSTRQLLSRAHGRGLITCEVVQRRSAICIGDGSGCGR